MKYLVSFRTTLKVSRYLFRALALLLWLLVALLSVFYIVNALHQKEAEIRQEFNLSSDQAQRYIQRTSCQVIGLVIQQDDGTVFIDILHQFL